MAPGHEGATPEATQLQGGCNMGYADGCSHLPLQRAWDAIRFAISREQSVRVSVTYVCEKDHLPGEHGLLEYSLTANQWTTPHPNHGIQRLAECFLDSWRSKTGPANQTEGGAEVPTESVK